MRLWMMHSVDEQQRFNHGEQKGILESVSDHFDCSKDLRKAQSFQFTPQHATLV